MNETAETFNIETSKYLNNGAQILNRVATGRGDWLVLCFWECRNEYVTWRVDSGGHAYWGRYSRDIVDAAENFKKRLDELKDNAEFTIGDLVVGNRR